MTTKISNLIVAKTPLDARDILTRIRRRGSQHASAVVAIVGSGREPWRLFRRRHWWIEFSRNLCEAEIVPYSAWCSENCSTNEWFYDSISHRWFFLDETDHLLFLTRFTGG